MSIDNKSINHWCRTVVKLPRGRVLLRNLLYDIDRDRIPRDLFEQLVEHLRQAFRDDLPATAAVELIDRFRDAAREHRTCSGRGGPASTERCSRIIDEGSCLLYNIDRSHYSLPLEDEPPTWFFQDLARRPLDPDGIQGQMNTGGGFVWVTRTDALIERLEAGSRADEARRGLGLEHLESGMRLLAIHYPEGAPWSVKHGPPTVIEGGARAVFRSTEGADGWGRAVDLDTLDDGLPELTHEPLDFDEHFTIEVLGPISEARKPSPETLADATAPMSEDWLEAAIVRLLEHVGKPAHDRSRPAGA